MKSHCVVLLFFTLALLSCSIAAGQDTKTLDPARLVSLPDDPCELLNPSQVSAITGLRVTSAKRVPSISKVIEAQDENREPNPGTICSYETGSEIGAIMIAVPKRADRHAAEYWEARTKYFETFPGSAKAVADLGKDAWLSGGTTLRVLVRGDDYFTVSTQIYQPYSGELVIKIARLVLDQL